MNAMALSAGSIAHDVHYAVLGAGLLGMILLLAPGWVGNRQPHEPRDEHELRVRLLHHQLAASSPGRPTPAVAARPPTLDRTVSSLLPIAVVSSTAASAVHVAVGPAHFAEVALFGIFFAATATLQIVWSVALVLRPSRLLLQLGLSGNAALLVLWLVTRTTGLPFGLLSRPETFGAWDLCCALWESITVVVCAALLGRTGDAALRTPRWSSWSSTARLWLIASSITLGVLSLNGVSS